MKKIQRIISVIVVALTVCVGTSAQETTNVDSLKLLMEQQQARLEALEKAESTRAENESFDNIWKQRKHITVGIGSQKLRNLDDDDMPALKSSISFAMQMGRTFWLHKAPIANMVKIGLDWNYAEIHFAKYKKFNEGIYDYDLYSDYYDDYDDDDDDEWGGFGIPDLGYYQIDGGMAVGPQVHVTPFYTIGKGLEYIKAYTYFHVIPSYSAIILSEDGETSIASGYVTNFSWGIGVSYRSLSFGFETRWGSGKYDTSELNSDFGDDLISGDIGSVLKSGDKTKYKTTSSRFTISLRF